MNRDTLSSASHRRWLEAAAVPALLAVPASGMADGGGHLPQRSVASGPRLRARERR